MLKVTVQGLEELDEELDGEVDKIQKQIPSALQLVGTEMINSLRESIVKNVYERYTPREYIRRTDGDAYPPLESTDYMEYSVRGNTLEFGYFPSGEHENAEWYIRDGDDLIKW